MGGGLVKLIGYSFSVANKLRIQCYCYYFISFQLGIYWNASLLLYEYMHDASLHIGFLEIFGKSLETPQVLAVNFYKCKHTMCDV